MTANRPPVRIRVFFSQHKKTGLWKVESPDLRGLMLFDKDRDVLEEDLKAATVELLREEGFDVEGLAYEVESENDWVPDGGVAAVHLAAA